MCLNLKFTYLQITYMQNSLKENFQMVVILPLSHLNKNNQRISVLSGLLVLLDIFLSFPSLYWLSLVILWNPYINKNEFFESRNTDNYSLTFFKHLIVFDLLI